MLRRRPAGERDRAGWTPMEAQAWKTGGCLTAPSDTLARHWESRKAFVLAPWQTPPDVTIEDRDAAVQRHNQILGKATEETPLIMYTDGSGIESKVGAAGVDETGEHIALSQMGDDDSSTVYSAELRAIETAIELVLNSNELCLTRANNGLTIFADSQAALKALRRPRMPSSQVDLVRCIDLIRQLANKGIRTELRWIPGFAGRFFTGIGVGTLSAVGPLYNAELAPPEMRGLLVALQQMSTTIGIMVAYWIGYGTNYIGGTGERQSDWAWRTPLIIQGIPAIILFFGAVFFLPFSPRMLINKGREEEALKTLASLRGLAEDDIVLRCEFLEIKSEVLFEQRVFAKKFPHLAEPGHSVWRREFAQYTKIFRDKDNFKRVAIAGLIMFFQQWSGIDSIIYYASSTFQRLGLTSGTVSLLATGVVGIINVLATIPAIMIIDKVGRKPLLLAGSIGMFFSMIIVAVIVAKCHNDWENHASAGWAAVAFIWIYIANFGYSWGPASWVLIAEIFPLSIRAKGTSIGASSNWMNNFIVAFIVPPMINGIGWGMYLFFAIWLFIGALFIWFFIPETKNKTLEEMDIVFGSSMATEDRDIFTAAKEEVGLTLLLSGGEDKLLSGQNADKDISIGHLETA